MIDEMQQEFFGQKVDFALLWLIGKPVVENPGEKILGLGDVMMTSSGSIEILEVFTPKNLENIGIFKI
jgi:hypothetical protein